MTSKARWILGLAVGFAALVGLWSSIAGAGDDEVTCFGLDGCGEEGDDDVRCFGLQECGDETTTTVEVSGTSTTQAPPTPTSTSAVPTTVTPTSAVPTTVTPSTVAPAADTPTTLDVVPALPSGEPGSDLKRLPATGPRATTRLLILGLMLSATGTIVLAGRRRHLVAARVRVRR